MEKNNRKHLGARSILSACIALIGFTVATAGCGNDPLTVALNDDATPLYDYLPFIGPKTPVVDGIIPSDGSSDVPVTDDVTVTFNMAMNPSTVTVQGVDGACSGSVQISNNDFTTCFAASVSTTDSVTFTVTPAADLDSCENVKVGVTTGAQSAGAVPLAADYSQPNGFGTYGDTSADWTEDAGNPMILGGSTSGTDRAYYPFVIKVGATYHIWYGDGSKTRHVTSYYPDFNDVTFPAAAVTGLNATGPYHPRVLYNASGWDIGGIDYVGPFLMYYTDGANWTNSPRVAHSADGESWTDIGACTGINSYPLPPNNNTTVYNLAVLYEGVNTWKGYTDNGLGIIQYYTSTNGIDWTGQDVDIVGTPYDSWESAAWKTIAPFIIMNGSTYVLYYSSGTSGNDNAFGFATSNDGQSFTKDGNNPIFSIYDMSVPAWRDNRSYTSSVVQNGRMWLLYYSGRSSAGVYSVGFARRCGAMY